MYQKKDKSWIWKLAAAFFASMVLFTLLSRAVYQHGTAVVSAEAPGSGAIAHTVRTTGKTVQNQDLAVTTLGGLRVGTVAVNEGQQVHAGDVLFTLDLEYLAQTIRDQKREMEKQRLSIQDASSQNYAAAQQRSNQKAQAEENYTAAVSQAETTLARAEKNLEREKKALENFYSGVTREETLREALNQANADRQAAEAALAQLQAEIEAKVQEAVEQAKQEAAQPQPTGPEPLPTETVPQSAETEPPITEPQPTGTEPPTTDPQPAQTEPPATETQPQPIETGPVTAGNGLACSSLDYRTARLNDQSSPKKSVIANQSVDWCGDRRECLWCNPMKFPKTVWDPTQAQDDSGNGIRLVLLSEVTAPDLEAVEAAVRESYAQQLADAQAAVERTKAVAEDARTELEAYQAQQSSGEEPSEQELLAAVEQAQERYDDALAALKNAKTAYGRAIQSAELPDGSNHAAQIGQLNYERMAEEAALLEELQAQAGEIRAPVDGVVTSCRVQTGEKTTDTTSVLLADLSRGCKFSGTVTEEQSKYIGVGDLVTLQASSSRKRYDDLPVTLLAPAGEGQYQLTVQLPENTLALGASAELTFTRRSQPYNCCVPLSALHLDEKNQPYVLVAEEVKTVLGTQTQARKVPVTVLEQNETAAALADGSLSQTQKVIVSSDRPIGPGSRIRVS